MQDSELVNDGWNEWRVAAMTDTELESLGDRAANLATLYVLERQRRSAVAQCG